MEAKAWLVNIACSKPKYFGMAAELWTQKALAGYARKHAAKAGHPSLSMAGKATVNRILKKQALQPHKVKYYLEKRDPAFESKMKDVLLVYKEVHLQNDSQMLHPTFRLDPIGILKLQETMNTNGSGLLRF